MKLTHQKKLETEKKVNARRDGGYYVITHADGYQTKITKHKFQKRYERIKNEDRKTEKNPNNA